MRTRSMIPSGVAMLLVVMAGAAEASPTPQAGGSPTPAGAVPSSPAPASPGPSASATAVPEPSVTETESPGATETGTPAATETAAPDQASADGALQTVPLPVHAGRFGDLPDMPTPPWDGTGLQPRTAGAPVVHTSEIEVEPFELAAVTWRGDGELTAWVRTRSDGAWSSWYELPGDADHAPDAGSPESERTRNGTDPLMVPRSDAVQVRVDAPADRTPQDLRLDLIDAGSEPAEVAPMADSAGAGDGTDADDETAISPETATSPKPTIYSRASWGADESLREEPPKFGTVNGAFVHHTVSASAYSRSEVPRMIRSMYLYHVKSRGWNDVGYNFLVDRFGRIWEGRYGGVRRAVVGAHTYGYNSQAFAMAAIGTYTDTAPTVHMIRAYQRLFAWKFAVHGVDPRHPVSYDGERWPAIAGHRDAAATACPGDQLYARLHQIRRGTITEMGLAPSRDVNRNWRPDLLATRRDGLLRMATGNGRGYGGLRDIGTGWNSMDSMVVPGDWNGDGLDDLITRHRSDGSLWLYPSADNGNFDGKTQIGWGWQNISAIVGSDDFDGDGRPDLIARRSDGSLWLYPRGTGLTFGSPTRIGVGWAGMNPILAPGDWDGDGIPDVVSRRRSDVTLWLYPGRGDGTLRAARRIGTGWGGLQLIASGDVDADRHADLVGRDTAGRLVLFRGDGSGGFINKQVIGTGWSGYNRIT